VTSAAIRDLLCPSHIHKLRVLTYGAYIQQQSIIFVQSCDCHRKHSSRIRLRPASAHRYEPLTTRLKSGERCFSHAGSKAWNALHGKIQDLTDIGAFNENWKLCFHRIMCSVHRAVTVFSLLVTYTVSQKNNKMLTSLHRMPARTSYTRKLPVCPSVKRVHCDKTEERPIQIFIPHQKSFSSVFEKKNS